MLDSFLCTATTLTKHVCMGTFAEVFSAEGILFMLQ